MKNEYTSTQEKEIRITEIKSVLESNLYANKEKIELIAEREELELQIELSKEM